MNRLRQNLVMSVIQGRSCLWGLQSHTHASAGRLPNQNCTFIDESSILEALWDSGSGDPLHSYLPKNYPEVHQMPTPALRSGGEKLLYHKTYSSIASAALFGTVLFLTSGFK